MLAASELEWRQCLINQKLLLDQLCGDSSCRGACQPILVLIMEGASSIAMNYLFYREPRWPWRANTAKVSFLVSRSRAY